MKATAPSGVRFGGHSARAAMGVPQRRALCSNLRKMRAVPPITLSNGAATVGLGFKLFSFAFVLNRSRI